MITYQVFVRKLAAKYVLRLELHYTCGIVKNACYVGFSSVIHSRASNTKMNRLHDS